MVRRQARQASVGISPCRDRHRHRMNLSEDHGPPSETSESNLTPRTESKEDDSVLSYEAVGADEGTYLSAREAPFYESQAAPQPHVLQVPWGWLDLLLLGCAF